MQPNKENIRKWVNALRSGDFAQTKGVLANRNGYCCLGVACEVALNNNVALKVFEDDTGCKYYDDAFTVLPRAVQNWLGVDSENPWLGEAVAAHWNDKRNYNFDQIADLIEQEYLSEEAA